MYYQDLTYPVYKVLVIARTFECFSGLAAEKKKRRQKDQLMTCAHELPDTTNDMLGLIPSQGRNSRHVFSY